MTALSNGRMIYGLQYDPDHKMSTSIEACVSCESKNIICDLFDMLFPMQSRKSNILIYGSCVSRDIQRITNSRYHLLDYIARQTLVSAYSTPLLEPDTTTLSSKFLERAVKGDFTSNAPSRIKESARKADAIIIDLASERHGVIQYKDGLLSRTNDLFKSNLLTANEFNRSIKFDSIKHRKMFRAAAIQLKELLREEKAFRKTLIIAAPFTDVSINGSKVPLSHHKNAETINNEYSYYYRLLKSMGFAILSLPEHLCKTTPDHTWGISQDHYIPEAYEYLADQIDLFILAPATAKRVFRALNAGTIFNDSRNVPE